MSTQIIRFAVTGMTCGSCVNRIMRSVARLDGVTKVSVDLRHETATVRRDATRAPDGVIAGAIASAGYAADLAAAVILAHGSDRSRLDRFFRRS